VQILGKFSVGLTDLLIMKRSLYRGFVRLQSYVEPATADRVDQYCADTGLSESALIKSSLTKYLDGTNDATLLLRRMDRLGRARERDHRDLARSSKGCRPNRYGSTKILYDAFSRGWASSKGLLQNPNLLLQVVDPPRQNRRRRISGHCGIQFDEVSSYCFPAPSTGDQVEFAQPITGRSQSTRRECAEPSLRRPNLVAPVFSEARRRVENATSFEVGPKRVQEAGSIVAS
jgi:hypothetical protein